MTEYNAERLKAFGLSLRKRRGSLGLNAKTFAERIGISPQHLSQLETGYSREGRKPVGPGNKVIEAISTELKWPITEIRRELGQLQDNQESTFLTKWQGAVKFYDASSQQAREIIDDHLTLAYKEAMNIAKQEDQRLAKREELKRYFSVFEESIGEDISDAALEAAEFALEIGRELQEQRAKEKHVKESEEQQSTVVKGNEVPIRAGAVPEIKTIS